MVDQSFLKFNETARQRWQTYVIAIQFGAYLGHIVIESGLSSTVSSLSGSESPNPAQKTKMVWRISTGRATAALYAFVGRANLGAHFNVMSEILLMYISELVDGTHDDLERAAPPPRSMRLG